MFRASATWTLKLAVNGDSGGSIIHDISGLPRRHVLVQRPVVFLFACVWFV